MSHSHDQQPIRLALLGDRSSVHVPRLQEGLKVRGFIVETYSLEPFEGEGVWIPPVIQHPQQLRYILSTRRLGYHLDAFQPQVTVAVSLANYGLMAWALGVRPLYLMLWGSDLLFSARKTPLHRWVSRKILQHAHRLNVDSLDMFHDLVQTWGISPDRIDWFTWGLSSSWFTPLGEKPAPPPWRVISSRRMDPDMDPLTVVEGVAQAVRQGLNLHLDLVGDGTLRKKVEARVQALGLTDRVTFHGWKEAAEIRQLLDQSHIYVASPWIDSTSVSLLEAMARGVIPVVSDLPANREWLVHGYTGFFFPSGRPDLLAEGLRWAISHAPDEAPLINRQVVERRVNWETHLDHLAGTLRNLLQTLNSER